MAQYLSLQKLRLDTSCLHYETEIKNLLLMLQRTDKQYWVKKNNYDK